MEKSKNEAGAGGSGCRWGCLAVLIVLLAVAILGWEVFGSLGMFVVFVAIVVDALRTGSFGWSFNDRRLRRETHPLAFWSLAALNGALALASLWMFLEDARLGSG
jgi:hypothetical protein